MAIMGNNEERVRHIEAASFWDLCAKLTLFVNELPRPALKVLVQNHHLREVLSSKPLSVVNMCGKMTHTSSLYLHAPGSLPYVKKESNDFGLTDTVYTRFCNFHTGSNKTSTLFRAGTSSEEIWQSICHVFVLDTLQDVFVTNIVYNARLGHPVAAHNEHIQVALSQLNVGKIVLCMPAEECMFVHCFKLKVAAQEVLQDIGFESVSVRINICRTGVVNLFVGLPGGLLLRDAPERKVFPLCEMLLQAIRSAT